MRKDKAGIRECKGIREFRVLLGQKLIRRNLTFIVTDSVVYIFIPTILDYCNSCIVCLQQLRFCYIHSILKENRQIIEVLLYIGFN